MTSEPGSAREEGRLLEKQRCTRKPQKATIGSLSISELIGSGDQDERIRGKNMNLKNRFI